MIDVNKLLWGDLSLLFPKLNYFDKKLLFMISSYYIYFCAVNSGNYKLRRRRSNNDKINIKQKQKYVINTNFKKVPITTPIFPLSPLKRKSVNYYY